MAALTVGTGTLNTHLEGQALPPCSEVSYQALWPRPMTESVCASGPRTPMAIMAFTCQHLPYLKLRVRNIC